MNTERVRALVFVMWLKTSGFFGAPWYKLSYMFKSVVKICHIVSLFILNSSAIILMLEWRSALTRIPTFSIPSPTLIVNGWPALSPSSANSLPSGNLLCYSDTWDLDKVFSAYASPNKLNVFFSFTRNLLLISCSFFYQAGSQVEKVFYKHYYWSIVWHTTGRRFNGD
jgi:hypothetical protein